MGPLAKCVVKEVLDDDVLGMAAELAYYAFFSIFPILLFLTPLLGLIGNQQAVLDFLSQQLAHAVPPEAQQIVDQQIRSFVAPTGAPGLVSVGAVLALWAGSNIFNNLITALNRAYDLEESRPWWKRRLIAMAMVIVSGFVLAVATTTVLAGATIIGWFSRLLGLTHSTQVMLTVAQYTLAFVFLVGVTWLVYYFLPNTRQSKRHALVGAFVASVLWVVAALGFRLYVANYADYNKTYGTIGAVIVLLTWMYLSMVVLLAGGELSSELHKGTASVAVRGGKLFGGRIATGGTVDRASVTRVEQVRANARPTT
ncbi:MAG TPA: YihY/virulence factor BrkB family protein [Gemmatimonadaceae bacterium]|nr:YihY/virulence factor BrkB family protein [Gemmatimonadaceae bacterium]